MNTTRSDHKPVETGPIPRLTSVVEPSSLGLAFSEASALLLLWSILVITEGAIRFNELAPYPDLELGDGRPASGWFFFASLFEVVFGFIGLFLGLCAFIFRFYDTIVTKACMIVQTVLGIYVFVMYVFVQPSYLAMDLTEQDDGLTAMGISLGLHKLLIVLGIFTSFHFCLALQGGQFVFMARMVTAATGEDFLRQKSGHRMRAMFWSGNLALAGLWTLITGAVLNSEFGGGRMDMTYAFPPNVGRVPALTVCTGLVMLLSGMYGVAIGAVKLSVPKVYYLLSAVAFLFTWLNFTIVQFGFVGFAAKGIGMHNGLVFMISFLGPYFVWCLTSHYESVGDKTAQEFV